MSTAATPPLTPPAPPSSPVTPGVIQEIEEFCTSCLHKYSFNSRCDTLLNTAGILLSVAIIAAGLYEINKLSAILGGLVAAIVTAQRAFPFNQRWQFYRTLSSQVQNLKTEAKNGVISLEQAIQRLNALRLDFAQQIPRGSTFKQETDQPPPPDGKLDTPPAQPEAKPATPPAGPNGQPAPPAAEADGK